MGAANRAGVVARTTGNDVRPCRFRHGVRCAIRQYRNAALPPAILDNGRHGSFGRDPQLPGARRHRAQLPGEHDTDCG